MTTRRLALLAAAILGLAPAWADDAAKSAPPVIFIHVNLVPMDSERVVPDQSVLVENGTIVKIASDIPAPAGATVIDGHGTYYLTPGLADMHIHSSTMRDMALFLSTGVTTVLNMGGARASFMDSHVPKLNRGEEPGPHFYAGFVVDGTPEYGQFVVATPEEARGMVSIAKTNGYDFIKVYNNIAPDTFQAFIDEGKRQGIPVIGHGVTRVGLEKQFEAGQIMVAHTEEYFYTVFFPPGDTSNRPPNTDQIGPAIAFTKKSGAYVTADLNTYLTIARQWARPDVVASMLKVPHVELVDPDDRIRWRFEGYDKRDGSVDLRAQFLRVFSKALADSGVPLITGTDVPTIPGLVPGYALHEDMAALEAAGLTRYQVLTAATRTPGEFMEKAKPDIQPFGTIEEGSRADLILSSGNPLDDLKTLERPLGVMATGRWYDAAALKALQDEVLDQYREAFGTPAPAP